MIAVWVCQDVQPAEFMSFHYTALLVRFHMCEHNSAASQTPFK